MADGTVTIKANFDGKQAESGVSRLKSALGSLKSAGGQVGSIFKSVLGANLVSSAVIGGVQSLGNAIRGTFSSAISEGAKLQQSLGGIETLFKESADIVKNYASQAYRTAGISANEYMENVTAFSASLISSLGGDTAAAAELANRAMTDMSDNANKMGSSMESITQTYQSLARGNYAMLDNLKLGYGGTKAEMERLIKDAASYKDIQDELNLSVKEGDLSFANMVKAISVVQKKLDITGTTAKEASSTFSGSFASMKAAFKDFLGNLTTGGNITSSLQALAKTASTFVFRNFIPMVANAFKALPQAISTFIASAKPELEAGLRNLFPESVVQNIMGSFEKIESFFSKVGSFAKKFADTGAIGAFGQALKDIGSAIGNVMKAFSSGKGDWTDFGTTLGNITKAVSEVASGIANFIAKMDSSKIQSWAATIASVVGGFKLFSAVTGKSPVGSILGKLGEKFSLFGQKGEEGSKKAGRGGSLVTKIFNGLGTLLTKLGTGLSTAFKGLGTGISTAAKGIGQALSTVAQGFGKAASMANPAQWLSMGAAMLMVGAGVALAAFGISLLVDAAIRLASAGTGAALALLGLGVGIAALAGIFALLGPALTAGAVGIIAFGAAVALIGAGIFLATSGLAMLAGHLPTIATYGASAAVGIAALGAGLIVMGAGALVAGAGAIVLGAGLIVAGAGAVVAAAGVVLLGAALLVASVGVAAFGAALNVASPFIDTFANAVKTVVDALSGAIIGILDSISGVIKEIGQAALNAGKGFNLLAQGVQTITSIGLGSLATKLGAVAIGIGKIAGNSSGLAEAGTGMAKLGQGLMQAVVAAGSLATTSSMIRQFAEGLKQLPTAANQTGAALQTFASSALASLAGLAGASVFISAFASQLTSLGATMAVLVASSAMASALFTGLSAGFTALVGVVTSLGTALGTIPPQLSAISGATAGAVAGMAQLASSGPAVAAGFAAIGVAAATALLGLSAGMAQATVSVLAGTAQMTTAVTAMVGSMSTAGQAAGLGVATGVVSGISTGTSGAVSAMNAMMSAVQAAGKAGVGVMQGIGAQIGNGLAAGMLSALGAVTAAANALVEQANRAAQAKAQIHSPSRLFRDQVGRYIAQGMAVGIEKNAYHAENAMGDMVGRISKYKISPESLIGVGRSSFDKAMELKASAEQSVKTQVEVITDKANQALEKALDIADKAMNRPVEMRLNDDTLVARTGHKYSNYQASQAMLQNRMRGIVT